MVRTACVLVALALTAAVPGRAQSTAYYITDGDAEVAYIVQNGTLQSTFSTFDLAYPPAVRDTLLLHHRDDEMAVEYTLAGVPTGATYPGSSGFSELLDGTTDGVQYNYAVECCGDGVYNVVRTDLNWQGSTVLFELPPGDEGNGITYDPTTGHLFVSIYAVLDRGPSERTGGGPASLGGGPGTIREFDLAGNVLNSFPHPGVDSPCCLAYEEATDTLWVKDNGGNTLYQLDKTSGALLDSVTIPGFDPDNDWGGEMVIAGAPGGGPIVAVPALGGAGLVLLALVLAAAAVARTRGLRTAR